MELKRLHGSRPSSSGNSDGSVGREKRVRRQEILAKKKAIEELIKAAYAVNDHLSSFLSFRHFHRNGISVNLESGRGDKLSSAAKHYIHSLLKLNMEGPYKSDWPVEEKVKRKEMVAPEARYIFVHEAVNSISNEMTTMLSAEKTSTRSLEESGPLVGFVQYRFILEEEIPVLYVYELQLELRVQGKGLGKFLMQLIELIAQKNCMSAVMLTVQKANLLAMDFYLSKLRYIISATSPSRVNPMLGTESNYEILCKTLSDEAKIILEAGHHQQAS